jgi:hypothetical protein
MQVNDRPQYFSEAEIALPGTGTTSFCCVLLWLLRDFAAMGGVSTMAATNATIDLFSALPQHLPALLFANAKLVHLAAEQMLFVAGDSGDGCYRIEKGLLKVSIVSARAPNASLQS